MGKLLMRKIAIAIVFALIAPFIVVIVLSEIVSGIMIGNQSLSLDTLMGNSGGLLALIVLGFLTFLVSFVSAQLVPGRRRRNRSSGTIVESDVEDGRERGVVKWFNVKKGFGFITWDEGEDVFVHFRSIRGQGHRSLNEGQRVKFTVVRGDKGPQAEDVSAVK